MDKNLQELLKDLLDLKPQKESDEIFDKVRKLFPGMDAKDLYKLLKKVNPEKDGADLLSWFKKLSKQDDLLEKLKKLGPQSDLKDVFEKLKKLGFQVEFKVNGDIQDSLNKKEIMKLLHKHSHIIAPIVECLQELVETVSVPLNLPTKNDVANVAKLTLQNEEKIDSIEEQLEMLNGYLKKLISDDVPTYTKSPKQETDEELAKKLKMKKKIALLEHLLQSSSDLLNRKG